MDTRETFNNEAQIYEVTSRQVNVYYDEGLNKFVELLPPNAKNVLDVCCGTGILTSLVRKKYLDCQIVGLDFSSGMLNVAKGRFTGDKKIKFICADLLDGGDAVEGKFDLITSSYGIHNIHTKEAKLKALKVLFDKLECGGRFFTCDILKGNDEEEQKKFDKIQYEFLLKSFEEKEADDWMKLLKEEDNPETWEDNKIMLERVGFKNIKLLWKKDFLAIWTGEKE